MGQGIAGPTTRRSRPRSSVGMKGSSIQNRSTVHSRKVNESRNTATKAVNRIPVQGNWSNVQGPFFPSSPALAGPGLDAEGRLVAPEQVAMYALNNALGRGVQEAKESLNASAQYFVDELKGLNDVTYGALWDVGTQLGEGKADLSWLGYEPLEAVKQAASQAVTELAQLPGKALTLHGGRAAGQLVGTAATVAAPFAKTPVYRVWGGGAPEFNPSWTTVDPRTVARYRRGTGLRNENTGEMLTSGTINNLRAVVNGARFTKAARGPGGPGGLPEVKIPNAAKRVKVKKQERLRERM